MLDQTKFAKPLGPNVVDLSQKNRLLIVDLAAKDDERAICTFGELSNEILIRSISVEADDLQSA